MDSKRNIVKSRSILGCGDILKKSQSELALEELFAPQQKINHKPADMYGVSDHQNFVALLDMDNSHYLHFPFKNSVSSIIYTPPFFFYILK